MDNQILDPHDNDVLCGRGGYINSHPGNERFRKLVEKRKRVYLAARFKREKRLVANSIVSEIRALEKPGRFLAKDSKTGNWFDIGDEKARDKTSQALRENAPTIRAEIKVGMDQRRAQQTENGEGPRAATATTSSISNSINKKATSSKSQTKGKKGKEKAPATELSKTRTNSSSFGYAPPSQPPPPPPYYRQPWQYYPPHPGYGYPQPKHPPPYFHDDMHKGPYVVGYPPLERVPIPTPNHPGSMIHARAPSVQRPVPVPHAMKPHDHNMLLSTENMHSPVIPSTVRSSASMHPAPMPTKPISNFNQSNFLDVPHGPHTNHHGVHLLSSSKYHGRRNDDKRTLPDNTWEPTSMQDSEGVISPGVQNHSVLSQAATHIMGSWEYHAAFPEDSMEEEIGQEVELVESTDYQEKLPARDISMPTRDMLDDELRMPPPVRSSKPRRIEIDWTSKLGCQSSWLPDSFASPSFCTTNTSSNNNTSLSIASMDISAIESSTTGVISGISGIGTSGTEGMSCAGSVGGGSLCHVFSQDQILDGSAIPMTKAHSMASSAHSVASAHSLAHQESFKSWNATTPERCKSPSFSDRSYGSKPSGLEYQISPVATSTSCALRSRSRSASSRGSRGYRQKVISSEGAYH